jgi:gamma-glutamyl:cysteine ligase YbdK (ATP-grasp superfamily)
VLGQIGGSRKNYAAFIAEGLERGYETPWGGVTGQVVLGKDDFVEEVRGRVERGTEREQPSAREFSAQRAAVILRKVCRQFGVERKRLGERVQKDKSLAAALRELEDVWRHK